MTLRGIVPQFLGDREPTPAGLYFPFQGLDHATYLARVKAEGGSVVP